MGTIDDVLREFDDTEKSPDLDVTNQTEVNLNTQEEQIIAVAPSEAKTLEQAEHNESASATTNIPVERIQVLKVHK